MTARMSFTTVPRLAAAPEAPARRGQRRTHGNAPQAGAGRARSFPIQPLAAALALGFAAPSSHGLPQGHQVVQGSAQVSQQGSHLQVTNTPGAVIQWQSFGIGSGQSVYFQQQSARSAVLNRVTGGRPSEILGTLGSNGRVFLVNGAGIVFGKGAVIDTAGFTASTLNISDADWQAGKVRLQAEGVPGGIAITDVVQVHGDLYLIAPQITNSGALKVQAGQAILAAGQAVAITGRGLEGIQLEVVNSGNEVLNLGSVEAGAVGMFAGTLRHSGTVQANAVESIDGRVWLKARDSAEVSGSVAARRGGKGGEIVVTGGATRIASTASLDASGLQGGGQVLVGGGWQGKDASIANAQSTRVDQGAQLKADAVEVGDGGTVVVWSDGHTASHGAISARGGAQGGNGGMVETSGKTLARSGLPDVSAANGRAGTWLLDPDQVVIRAGFGSGGFAGDVGAADPAPTEIYESEIEGYSGNLTIQARQAITGADWGSACGSDGVLAAPFNGGLRLETTDATCPTSPCGIDLVTNGPSQIRALASSVSTSAVALEFSAGLTNPAVAGDAFKAEVRLNSVRNSTGGDVLVAAHGNIAVGDINTDATGAGGTWAAGSVNVSSTTGALEIGSISAQGASTPGATAGRGGDITLEGTQQVGGGAAIVIQDSVVTAGGAGSFEQNGGDAGNITVVLNEATDGSAGVLQLDNPPVFAFAFAPAPGGAGLLAEGGTGGDSFTPVAATGGNGGNITIRGGTPATAIRVDATSGAQVVSTAGQGGSDASGSLGVTGAGGNAGLIEIQGADITLDGGVYASLTRATSADINLTADATAGAVRLHNGATLVVAGHDPGASTVSAAQCTDCALSIQAGAGGVTQQTGSELIVTPELKLQVGGGGDVTLDGNHALGQVHGSVAGDLSLTFGFNPDDPQDLSLGAIIFSGSASTSLGLNVGGNLTVTSGPSAFIPVHIAAAVVVGDQATFNDPGSFSIDAGGSLQAGGAVNIVAQGDVLISPETHSDSSDSSNEQLTINSDEIARISTPVLRIDNTAAGATSSLFIGDNAAGTPDALDLTAGGNIGQVSLNTAGAVSQGLTSVQVSELAIQARTIDLANAGNQIDTVAFRATGAGGVHGTATIVSANGMTVGTVANAVDGTLAGGQATAATAGSGSSFVDLDAGIGTFTLSEAVIGPSVRVAGAAIENGTAQGRIQATSAGTHVVTLQAAGNIGGAASIAQAIRVQLADAATDDQILAQAGSLSPVGLHIQGDGRTAQVDFAGSPTGGALALVSDGELTVDRSVSGFGSVGLLSVNGDVALTTGTVNATGTISVNADSGAILGNDALTSAQLAGQAVHLRAAHGIEATTSTETLSVGETVPVAGAADVSINNVGTSTLTVNAAANADGALLVRTAGAMSVAGAVSGQSVALAGEGVSFQAGGAATATGTLSVDAGGGALSATAGGTKLTAAQLQLDAGTGIDATFDAAQVSANNSGSSGDVNLTHAGTTAVTVDASSNTAGAWNLSATSSDVILSSDAVTASGAVSIRADAGAIQGSDALTSAQLTGTSVTLQAAHGIAATTSTQNLSVGEAVPVAGAATVSINNVGTSPLTVNAAANADGSLQVRTAGAMSVAGAVSGQSVALAGEGVSFQAGGAATAAGTLSVDAGGGALSATAGGTKLTAAQLQLDAGAGIDATFDAAQVSANNSGSSGDVNLTHAGTTAVTVNDSSNAAGAWSLSSAQAVSVGTSGSPTTIQAGSIGIDAGGNLSIAAGSLLDATTIALTASGNIAGDATSATAQLRAALISLDADGGIDAAIDTGILVAESRSAGGTMRLANLGTGLLSVNRAVNLDGDVILSTAGDLEVRAQSSGALVQGQNVSVTAQGDVTVAGASSFSTVSFEVPAAVVPAPSDSGAIVATDTLTLNAGGALVLEGDATAAHVAGEHVNITASSLSLTGGSGSDAYAAIQYGSDITLGLPSGATLSFTPGSGADADAVIYTTSATPSFVSVDPTWSCIGCTPDFDHSIAGPIGNTVANQGLTQAPPETGGTDTNVDIPVIQVLVQLQRILEEERFGKVAVEAENVCR